MHIHAKRLGRDAAAAAAVLTIYLLTLLIPLHQAQATQDRFEALGFDNLSGWSLCVGDGTEPAESEKLPTICSLAGLGKLALALLSASAVDFDPAARLISIVAGIADVAVPTAWHTSTHPPRAPPVLL